MDDLPNPAKLEHCRRLRVPAGLDALQELLEVAEQEGAVEAIAVTPHAPQSRVSLRACPAVRGREEAESCTGIPGGPAG